MAAAGLGDDLLLANEVLDARRLGALADAGARVTVAVDSAETVEAAAAGGVREVLVDVNVGLPRCGCAPEDAGRLADLARSQRARGARRHGLRGPPHAARRRRPSARTMTADCMAAAGRAARGRRRRRRLRRRHRHLRGSTPWATEIQAGSYALMDTAYGALGLPFRQALSVLGHGDLGQPAEQRIQPPGWSPTSGSSRSGMDHGNPTIDRRDGVVLLRRAHHVRAGRAAARSRSATGCGCCPRTSTRPSPCTTRLHLVDGDDGRRDLAGRPARLVSRACPGTARAPEPRIRRTR